MNNRYRNKTKWIKGPKFTNTEIWNLFSVLGRDIHKGLVMFKKKNIDSYPYELGSLENWHEVIDKMIWSFNEINHDHPNAPINLEFKRRKKESEEKGLDEFYTENSEDGTTIIKFNEIYNQPYSKEILKEQEEYLQRIDEGTMLFAKHFEQLWD